jgi:hypothetical protein
MADQWELPCKNQELIRRNRQLERELQNKEKALTEAATLLMPSTQLNQIFQQDEEP